MPNRQNQHLPDPTSPFARSDLKPVSKSISGSSEQEIVPIVQQGTHLGIRLESGQILVNFDTNTNYQMLSLMAKHIHGEVVVVKGTWTFEMTEVVLKNGKK